MFPSWDNGFKRILQVIELEQEKQLDKITIDRLKKTLEIPVVNIELGLISSKYTQFKGEKEFFVQMGIYK